MNAGKALQLKQVLQQGIGADVVVEQVRTGLRSGLRAHFADLKLNHGPICTITPFGLKQHKVELRFGDFSAPLIQQMMGADYERIATARGLLRRIALSHVVTMHPGPRKDDWVVSGGDFGIEVVVRNVEENDGVNAMSNTAREVMVPLLAAMAELIGYDESVDQTPEVEGEVTEALILKRERSRRNRYLCLEIHGRKCAACGFNPSDTYGDAGDIVEVHHLEPVSLLQLPRQYDPAIDLVPLCPNCHRLIHTKKPIPYTLEELKELLISARNRSQ